MRATTILSEEHQVILRVVACLERVVDAAVRTSSLEHDAAQDVLQFLRTYADAFHHAKEEDLLFPRLAARGFPAESGPVAVMLHEHELGRAAVRAMQDSLDGAAAGQEEALATFAHHARAYVELLRQHIRKEDHVLYPMACEILTEGDDDALVAAYAAAEDDQPAGTRERMLALAARLGERYGVPPSETAAGAGSER